MLIAELIDPVTLAAVGPSVSQWLADGTQTAAGLTENAVGLLAQDDAAQPEMTFFQRLLTNPLILPVGLVVLFYLTLIAPERRRKADEAKLIASLKKNDRVVTIGGIHGTVVATSPETGIVTLRIDENSNTRIKVNRTAIANILRDGKENKDASGKETTSAAKDK